MSSYWQHAVKPVAKVKLAAIAASAARIRVVSLQAVLVMGNRPTQCPILNQSLQILLI